MAANDPTGSCPTELLRPLPASPKSVPEPLHLHPHGGDHAALETFPRLTLNEETLRAAAARSHAGAVKPQGRRRARNARYRTQPVTFTEILEVDEPATPGPGDPGPAPVAPPPADLDQIKNELAAFSLSMQDSGPLPSVARPGSAAGP